MPDEVKDTVFQDILTGDPKLVYDEQSFFFDPIFFLLIRKSIGSFDINMIPYKYYA
jgi:hypothetical protein